MILSFNRNGPMCGVLERESFLQKKAFNIWDCYSEYESSFNDRLHFHDFFELSVIYEGTSRFQVNENLFSMGEGSLQLVRPSDYHRQLTGPGEHIRYYNLMFSAEFISEDLLLELERSQGPLCATASQGEWERLLRLVREIEAEFPQMQQDRLSEIDIRCRVEYLCTFLMKAQRSQEPVRVEAQQKPIRKAILYIQSNYRRAIQLADAADAAGLSPSYFSRLFHETMRIPFSRYLTAYRLQVAGRYLKTGEFSVKQIAALCGFPSYSYFITVFKEHFGVSPNVWRATLKRDAR